MKVVSYPHFTEPFQKPDGTWRVEYALTEHYKGFVEWGHKPTKRELGVLYNSKPLDIGEGNKWTMKRYVFLGFVFIFGKNIGPPCWWLPKAFIKRERGFVCGVGWRYTAFSLSIGRDPR